MESIFSVKNKDIRKVITIFGIKFKFKSQRLIEKKRWNDLNHKLDMKLAEYSEIHVNNLTSEQEELKNKLSNIENKLNKIYDLDRLDFKINSINQNIVKTFQYLTGVELNKNFIQEREIVFDPEDVPLDHYNRYVFASSYINNGDTVGDIACTCGYGSKILSKKANLVIGVDINPYVVDFANKVYGGDKIKFFAQDAQNLDLDYSFDTIVSFETIEHIPNPELFLKKVYNLLKPQGKIICSVPNEDKNHYATANNKFHYRHYTENQFRDLIESNGFKVERLYHQYWDDDCSISDYRSDKDLDYVLVIIATKK
jgi:2-polyprenyl-3-methyl-5-hydroxy-6-metoxy-1,4-benzoquinol methylase